MKRGIAAAALGICLTVPASALAETDNTQITLNGGALSYSTPFSAGNFPTTSLTGLQQVARANVNPWTITDARGSLTAGWNVTVAASQFTDGSKTLPTGSMSLVNVPTIGTTVGNLSLPPVSVPAALAIDGGGAAQKIATAAIAQGLGQWTLTPLNAAGGDLILTIPPDAQPGTYTSTITTTLATGP